VTEDTLSTSPPAAPEQGTNRQPVIIHKIFIGADGLRVPWRLLLFFAIFFASGRVIVRVLVWISHAPRPTVFPWWIVTIGEVIRFGCAFFAAWVMSRIERRPMGPYGLPARGAFGRNFWAGCVWGVVTVSALMLAIWAAHGFSFGSIALSPASAVYFAAGWFVAYILVGLFEEFITRGYPQFTLATATGFWPAAILFSAAFGAVHLLNPGEGLIGALSAAFIGLWLAFTLRRTGDLWLAVGFHAAFDWGETYLYSVPNSGLVAPGHLLNADLHGPRWLSGGTVGPEGSVFCFIIIALLFVAFDRVYRPRAAEATTR
jgi:membrane protease YdiL (CAAX protease family)